MRDHRSSDAGLLETLAAEDETLRAGNRKSSGTNSSEWLVNIADDVVVPMLTSEVVEALRAGRLTNRSLVWRIGMHDWSALAEVPQLRLAAGPSALPPAASTPGPVIHKALVAPEQRRRSTLPFGLPAVKPKDDSGALAVYDRPTASLTFADSVRAEWQGAAVDHQAAPPPQPPPPPAPLSAPRAARPSLSPVPPVPSRLPQRALRSLPTNTLAPTTAEAALAAPNLWGDLSVVLASELRAEKKATKRLMLWAAVGSAVAASVFTFWVSRSVARPTGLAPAAPAAAPRAAPALPPEPLNVAPSVLATAPPLSAAAVAPVAGLKPAVVAIVQKPRPARPKPRVVAAPIADGDSTNAAPLDDSAADKPGVPLTLPMAAPAVTTAAAPAVPVATVPAPAVSAAAVPGPAVSAAAVPARAAPPASPSATPGAPASPSGS